MRKRKRLKNAADKNKEQLELIRKKGESQSKAIESKSLNVKGVLKNTPFKKDWPMWEEKDKLTTNLVYSASDRKTFHFSKFGVLREYFQNLHIGEGSLIRKLDELSRHVPKSRNTKKIQTLLLKMQTSFMK